MATLIAIPTLSVRSFYKPRVPCETEYNLATIFGNQIFMLVAFFKSKCITGVVNKKSLWYNFNSKRRRRMNSVLRILREQKEMNLKGNIYHITQINFAYNTNHIEGSSLTEEQTRYIYETNTLIVENGNESTKVDDIIEMSNHFKLVDYMLDVAEKSLDENMIKEFHRILKTRNIR